MSTVVYLANQQIQVVVGTPGAKKIAVSNCYYGEAPDGSIINGMIMDPELFIGFMKEFWQTNNIPNKDVVLVVNTSKFVGKNIEIPTLNEKKTIEFIEREFTDVRRGEDSVFGYIPIGNNGKLNKIYAEAISPDFIKDYLDIFKEIGIKIKAIHSGESSLISLVQATAGKHHSTFVLQFADRMTITTLLFVNGSFYYFNSTRCFHEMDSEEYANDVARSVSQIIQFMQAHQIEYPLETIILAGINPNALMRYQEAMMMHGINVPLEVFYDENIVVKNIDIQAFLHAASGLIVNGNMQNFLKRYQTSRKTEKKEQNTDLRKSLIGIGITLAAMLIALISVLALKIKEKKKLDEAKEYNESPAVMLEVARYDALLERNSFLLAQYNAIKDIEENIVTYPICDSSVRDIVENCAGSYATVTFSSFDADEGYISMDAKADSVDNINLFIKALMAEDIFADVNYTGYNYNETEKIWHINVTCTLAESAGRW